MWFFGDAVLSRGACKGARQGVKAVACSTCNVKRPRSLRSVPWVGCLPSNVACGRNHPMPGTPPASRLLVRGAERGARKVPLPLVSAPACLPPRSHGSKADSTHEHSFALTPCPAPAHGRGETTMRASLCCRRAAVTPRAGSVPRWGWRDARGGSVRP